MKWLLIDNISPNVPVLVNLENVDCIDWNAGTLSISYQGNGVTELECEKEVFIKLAQALDIVQEVE